jgi:hypothetical protein
VRAGHTKLSECPDATERETQELIGAVRRGQPTLPWKSEFAEDIEPDGESVDVQRIGMAAFGECGPGDEEATEGNPEKCSASEADTKCYPTSGRLVEVPVGCISLNLVVGSIPLELTLVGSLEPVCRNGAGNAVDPSRLEFYGPTGSLWTTALGQGEAPGEVSFKGVAKELGSESQALLTLK